MGLKNMIEYERSRLMADKLQRQEQLRRLMKDLKVLGSLKDLYALIGETYPDRIIEAVCAQTAEGGLVKMKVQVQMYGNARAVEAKRGEKPWLEKQGKKGLILYLQKKLMPGLKEDEVGWLYEKVGQFWIKGGLVGFLVDVWVESEDEVKVSVQSFRGDKPGLNISNVYPVEGFDMERIVANLWVTSIEKYLERQSNNLACLTLSPGDIERELEF